MSLEDIKELYGIGSWGKPYFDVNSKGDLCALGIDANQSHSKKEAFPIKDIISDIKKQNISDPVLLRFPQILYDRVNLICKAFSQSIKAFDYKKQYFPAYPIKVNQTKTVVEAIVKSGFEHALNIEVGSKAEAVAALGLDINPDAMCICNGFKDSEYYDIISFGQSIGRNMMAVIEKPFELNGLLDLKQSGLSVPNIGIRIKLDAKGSGMWQKSGGMGSKFGLSINQLLNTVEWLKKNNLLKHLKMFHFHIGSQITDIRKIKQAVREAARIYSKACKMGLNIDYLNVGGGLGVDYDGSRTASDASVNYNVQEYANDIVYNVLEVCKQEKVEVPHIISESGRFLTAHHALLLINTKDQYHERHSSEPNFKDKEHSVVKDLKFIFENINKKNHREFYHDALQKKEEMQSLFHLGMIDLEDKAKCEWLFWKIAEMVLAYSKDSKFVANEFINLQDKLLDKLVCNFSVFQSIPDYWAIKQLFPIMPIEKLNIEPKHKASIVDITCDSDGAIENFVDIRDVKSYVHVHDLKNMDEYYLAIMLVGAYQDTMGDMHNLFGRVHEVSVLLNDEGNFTIDSINTGETVEDTTKVFGYTREETIQKMGEKIKDKKVLDKLNSYFDMYTYMR